MGFTLHKGYVVVCFGNYMNSTKSPRKEHIIHRAHHLFRSSCMFLSSCYNCQLPCRTWLLANQSVGAALSRICFRSVLVETSPRSHGNVVCENNRFHGMNSRRCSLHRVGNSIRCACVFALERSNFFRCSGNFSSVSRFEMTIEFRCLLRDIATHVNGMFGIEFE